MGGNVIVVTSKQHWDELIAQTKAGKVAIVDFFATWCGPCRMIAPFFEELSTANADVLFLKVDVDAVEAVAAEAGISAMPTFQVWKNGVKADELVGASKERLADMLQRNKRHSRCLVVAAVLPQQLLNESCVDRRCLLVLNCTGNQQQQQ